MSKFFSFIAGLLVGALVGSLVAILFAPMPGSELRSQIGSRADQVVADVKSAVEQERRRLESELEALKRGEIQLT